MSTIGTWFFLIILLVSSASAGYCREPDAKNWVISFEGGLGIGNMDHTYPGMEMELFGVDTLRRGGEQDGIGIRIVIGKRLSEDLTTAVYGGMSALFTGLFFDNHGPFIPPELCYSLKERSLGLEVRYSAVWAGAGYSFYSGTVQLYPDDLEGEAEGEIWEGKLGNTGGPHFQLGLLGPVNEKVDAGVYYIWRNIPLKFLETPTGVVPEETSRRMSEIRFMVQVNFTLL